VENLNNTDIQLLCDYRKKFLGVIEGQSRSLDYTVVKELISGLLAQDIKKADIAKGLTRLTKLICCYADTGSLSRDGDVLPKAIGGNGASSHSPTEPEAGMDSASSFHTVPSSSQQLASSYPISLFDQQPLDNVIEARTNTAKRRKVSGHVAYQTREGLCMIQEDNQSTSTPRSEASLTNTHGEHQALDVAMAANVLQSLQHGNQGYIGVVAAELELGVQLQPSPSTSSSTLAQRDIAENGGTGSASSDDHQVLGDGSAGLDMRLRHLSTSRPDRPEPDQQHFPNHLGLLPDGQVDEVHTGETTLINPVSGVTALESEQVPVADELFLSDFMQEYREMM
jgi:hypothetical protein